MPTVLSALTIWFREKREHLRGAAVAASRDRRYMVTASWRLENCDVFQLDLCWYTNFSFLHSLGGRGKIDI